jgi:hypothetical protein
MLPIEIDLTWMGKETVQDRPKLGLLVSIFQGREPLFVQIGGFHGFICQKTPREPEM